jgi:hypothetical protein
MCLLVPLFNRAPYDRADLDHHRTAATLYDLTVGVSLSSQQLIRRGKALHISAKQQISPFFFLVIFFLANFSCCVAPKLNNLSSRFLVANKKESELLGRCLFQLKNRIRVAQFLAPNPSLRLWIRV